MTGGAEEPEEQAISLVGRDIYEKLVKGWHGEAGPDQAGAARVYHQAYAGALLEPMTTTISTICTRESSATQCDSSDVASRAAISRRARDYLENKARYDAMVIAGLHRHHRRLAGYCSRQAGIPVPALESEVLTRRTTGVAW